MTHVGRKPWTTGHVDHLDGSLRAKQRLRAILKTMSGEWTVPQACASVGVQAAQFHTLRHAWLQGSLQLLEPKPVGRPPQASAPAADASQPRIEQLERDLALATARREVAEVLALSTAAKKGARSSSAVSVTLPCQWNREVPTPCRHLPRCCVPRSWRVGGRSVVIRATDERSAANGPVASPNIGDGPRSSTARRGCIRVAGRGGRPPAKSRLPSARSGIGGPTRSGRLADAGVLRWPRPAPNAVRCCTSCITSVVRRWGWPAWWRSFQRCRAASWPICLRRYRRVWRRRYRRSGYRLIWHVPGRVWAIDHSRATHCVDGVYRQIFAVRDVASHRQLAWEPVRSTGAEEVRSILWKLFAQHGPPLVIKNDNGSAFRCTETRGWMLTRDALQLFSPVGYPQYNGQLERSNAINKTYTHQHAVAEGHPQQWTGEDLNAARQLTNRISRPWGARGPTPEERWTMRAPISPEERDTFAAEVMRQRQEARRELGYAEGEVLDTDATDEVDRRAIGHALEAGGYLTKLEQQQRTAWQTSSPPRKSRTRTAPATGDARYPARAKPFAARRRPCAVPAASRSNHPSGVTRKGAGLRSASTGIHLAE